MPKKLVHLKKKEHIGCYNKMDKVFTFKIGSTQLPSNLNNDFNLKILNKIMSVQK